MSSSVTKDNPFGKKIRIKRQKKNLTQSQLAKKFNVEKQTVSNWENGYRKPDLVMVKKLATFFEVSIDYLMDHDFISESEVLFENKKKLNDVIIEELYEGVELHYKESSNITKDKLRIIKALLEAMDNEKK